MANYTPMIQQYLAIKAEHQDAFLFFRLGDFYEMFFEDAKLASKILEITLTARDGGEQKIPMCGIPYHSAESYITKLIENGYKVAICEQVEDPKEAKGVVKREVVRIVTPGTIMEGKLVDGKGNNYIAAVTLNHEMHFGLSISDITTGEFYVTEIMGGFEHVVNELSQFSPSELLIDPFLLDKFENEIINLNATITKIEAEIPNVNELLYTQFKDAKKKELSTVIKQSAAQLLAYLFKTQQKKLSHFNTIHIYDSSQFLILDQFSKRNLELTQTSREQTKKGSLIWLLDQTETAMGSRLLRRWVEKPLLNVDIIEERLNRVEELLNNPILTEDLRDFLKQIYDMERLISKVAYGNATPRDLFHLRKSIEQVPFILELINEGGGQALKELVEEIDACKDIAQFIEEAIVDDPPLSPKVGGIIKRGYNDRLDSYYLASTEGKTWLYELEKRERELTGIKSLKVSFNKVFGYFIEITKSNLSQVPTERYIRKQTLANAERYITEELKNKETIILEAEEKTQELEYQLFIEIREQLAAQNHRLQNLAFKIAHLDVLIAFSVISSKYRYSRPLFNNENKMVILEGRHPVIEAIHPNKPFIPNDVYLDQDNSQILIITGPNMAGKSTYMRQIALTVIMAQIGCFVPAVRANLTITDRIFTRIGAGDDLTSGQSTFMVEMLETKNAITQATDRSLILLDEIGRGTSTYDGMALAQAIIQYVHDKVLAKTLFSTHYHELTSLEDSFQRIKNIHVNVIERNGEVIFLHKIEPGKADKSYGIHVAELAGMPQEVIDQANIILVQLEAKATLEEKNSFQLELFSDSVTKQVNTKLTARDKINKEVADQIAALDLLHLTPMEGFQILYDIQKKLRK